MPPIPTDPLDVVVPDDAEDTGADVVDLALSLIHISEPTRLQV